MGYKEDLRGGEINMSEINNMDREELARLIKEGYRSGRLDSEDGKKIAWELKIEVWND